MKDDNGFEIFLVAPPGFEAVLLAEAQEKKFHKARQVPGGVAFEGNWPEVWRANLEIRGASRVLARLGSFYTGHLSELDKRASKFPWSKVLRPDVPVRVEVSCRKSRIYHSGAAKQRIERALKERLGVLLADDAAIIIKARIETDICTLSVDTSGTMLHKRGHKTAVAKAPMRETLAALFLRACGFNGTENVMDPMCGSGTFVIEAAEITAKLNPGRSRNFAFEQLASFDAEQWHHLRQSQDLVVSGHKFWGSDREAGAIHMAQENARRAGVQNLVTFTRRAIAEVKPPKGQAGLVICNPPYGERIGERKSLFGLYGALGHVLLQNFPGWRVGLITSDAALAAATRLPFQPTPLTVLHGGLRVSLHQTKHLP